MERKLGFNAEVSACGSLLGDLPVASPNCSLIAKRAPRSGGAPQAATAGAVPPMHWSITHNSRLIIVAY